MNPVHFPEANLTLTPPAGWPPEACGNLSTYADGKEIISCWELSDEELLELARHRRLWVRVAGQGAPPMSLQVEHPFRAAPPVDA